MDAYSEQLGVLAEDFINTFDLFLEEPEHLREPDDLKRFLAVRRMRVETVTVHDLEQARGLRDQLRAIWTTANVEDALRLLNPLLTGINVELQVAQEAETLHLEFDIQREVTVVERLAASCALGIVALLQAYGLDRLRACASSPCQDVFVDTSRNKARRFCSDRCANRYNIAAFRERQKGADEGDS